MLSVRWILLALALTIGMAQSQEPAPSARESSEKPKAQTAEDKHSTTQDVRGTKESPLVVETLPTLKSEEQTAHEHYEHHEKPTLDRWLSYATVALVGVTAALAVFTYFLWGATRRLVAEAKDTAKKQLRAYINVSRATISTKDNVQTIYLEIKNFGQTPAKKVVVWYDMAIGEVDWFWTEALEPTPNMEARESAVLAPEAIFHALLPVRVAWDERSDTKAFYFWGGIRYTDAFNQPQTTGFRTIVRAREWLTNTTMGICHKGNDAT